MTYKTRQNKKNEEIKKKNYIFPLMGGHLGALFGDLVLSYSSFDRQTA